MMHSEDYYARADYKEDEYIEKYWVKNIDKYTDNNNNKEDLENEQK